MRKDKHSKISLAKVVKEFNRYPKKLMNYKQLAKKLDVKNTEMRNSLLSVLNELVSKKVLIEPKKGKFRMATHYSREETKTISGIVDMTAKGAAFIISDSFKDDIYISRRNTNTAMHGDEVTVSIMAPKRKGQARPKDQSRIEGKIIEVTKRARTSFVGILEVHANFAFLIPDGKQSSTHIFIPAEKLKGAENGHKAIAKIVDWPETAKNPFGEITKVLGMPGENETERLSVLEEHGFSVGFPKKVKQELNQISLNVSEKEINKRKDFRKIPTFTIDPADAKDFDDALSVRKLNEGVWEIGIHIADVSHYVQPGSEIDKEAYSRATSVYLVDRVIPMLPDLLSNQACSLRPQEEKLCYSVVFQITETAEIKHTWLGKTIIFSDKRFTYQEAQEVIETQPSKNNAKKDSGMFMSELHMLNKLAKIFRKRRFEKGAMRFERAEVSFVLDDQGNPVDVLPKIMVDSNRLIEEFMLLANKAVAEKIGAENKSGETTSKSKPFVYRIHDYPDPEKLKSFAMVVKQFGYSIDVGSKEKISSAINQLLSEVKGKPESNLLETLAIRSMSKAVYSPENIGHYGLGFTFYSHFTSPIRRYPDLIIHRLLEGYGNGAGAANKTFGPLEDMCNHCSIQEKKAEEAERSSRKFKQAQFLKDKEGEAFDGIISGIMDFGFFVELIENKCEGLVRMQSLHDDHYVFDKDNYSIKGRQWGKKYQLGDKVSVMVSEVDVIKKQVDLEIVH